VIRDSRSTRTQSEIKVTICDQIRHVDCPPTMIRIPFSSLDERRLLVSSKFALCFGELAALARLCATFRSPTSDGTTSNMMVATPASQRTTAPRARCSSPAPLAAYIVHQKGTPLMAEHWLHQGVVSGHLRPRQADSKRLGELQA